LKNEIGTWKLKKTYIKKWHAKMWSSSW
jgi:hypothetical protein